MTLSLRYAARSHTGLLRAGNEDSVYAGPRLLAVADGMGGHAAGEVASAVAIAALAPLDEDVPGTDLLDGLRRSAEQANAHLRAMVAGDSALDGMGTTLVALLFAGGRLGLLHVGDSRCYLLRDGQLSQITHDHTLVQTLVDQGRISADEATTHPQRNVMVRALDGRPDVEFDLSVREVRLGDRYLLCSDGLTGPVASADTLREALQLPDPQEAVDRLVGLALRGGGPDNITVVVADVVEAGAASTAPALPVVAGAAAEAPQPPPAGMPDSAAERARAHAPVLPADRPTAAAAASPRPSPRPSHRRLALLGLGVAALLIAAAGTGWAYIRSQYYVGIDGIQVTVFRGVPGTFAGLPLQSVQEHTGVDVDGLSDLDTERLRDGIVAADLADAERIVRRLRLAATPSPTPSVSRLPSPRATAGPTSSRPPSRPTASPGPTRSPA